MAKQDNILRKIILPGTSDKDILGVDNGFLGLEYTIYKPTSDHEIFNADLKPDDQVWVRPEFPDFSKLTKKECQDLYIREIRRIKHGVYCWIGGILEYIAGKHYFGMVHCKLKESETSYLIYTETQRNIFYMFDLCEKDTKCAGAIIFSLKRLGKSELAQIEMFGDALLTDFGRYIVQALNDDEAIDIFGKTHYYNENLHTSLPIWSHKVTKSDPQAVNLVALKRESTKDSIVWKSADGIEGSNEVSFSVKPTKLAGIQGKKIKRAFLDEFASLLPIKEMNLENYYSKALAQVTEDFGAIVLGKIWLIATAENIKSEALPAAEKIWNGSDETKKDANGFTISKMKRMFIPYYLGGRSEMFMDKFGRPKVEEAKKFYNNRIELMKGGQKTLYRRQNPEFISDVFGLTFSGFWDADVKEKLEHCLRELRNKDITIKKVKLYEVGQQLFTNAAKDNDDTCAYIYEDPKPHVKYYAGFDGVASDIETGGEEGSAVSVTIIKAADAGEAISYIPVAYFKFRPNKIGDGYLATSNLCRHYNQYGNLKLGIERNAGQGSPMIAYCINRGYRKMLFKNQKITGVENEKQGNGELYGWFRNDQVKDVQRSLANAFLTDFVQNIPFVELLESLVDYGKTNQDFSDSFISAVYTMGDWNKVTRKASLATRKRWVKNPYGLKVKNGVTEDEWVEVDV